MHFDAPIGIMEPLMEPFSGPRLHAPCPTGSSRRRRPRDSQALLTAYDRAASRNLPFHPVRALRSPALVVQRLPDVPICSW